MIGLTGREVLAHLQPALTTTDNGVSKMADHKIYGNETTLKPCPFCGGSPSTNEGGNSTYGRFWWRVGCEACDFYFRDREVWNTDGPSMLDPKYPPKECFERWNARDIKSKPYDAAVLHSAECVRSLARDFEEAGSPTAKKVLDVAVTIIMSMRNNHESPCSANETDIDAALEIIDEVYDRCLASRARRELRHLRAIAASEA